MGEGGERERRRNQTEEKEERGKGEREGGGKGKRKREGHVQLDLQGLDPVSGFAGVIGCPTSTVQVE